MRWNKIFVLYISWNDLAKKTHVPVKTRFVYSRVHFLKIFFVSPFYYHTNNAGWFLACFSFVVCKERCTAARKLKVFCRTPSAPSPIFHPSSVVIQLSRADLRSDSILVYLGVVYMEGGRSLISWKVDHPSAICFLYSVYMRKVVLVPRARIFLAER